MVEPVTVPRIGVIGVGEIAAAIVEGLSSSASAPGIVLSPRNADIAAGLAHRFAGVRVVAGNQDVVDAAPLVILAVRRDHVADALAGLRFSSGHRLVSAVAGMSCAAVQRHVGEHVTVVRTIPLPAVRNLQGTTVVHPADTVVEALFDRVGNTLVATDEPTFDALSAVTATMSTHLHYLRAVADWAATRGVDPDQADLYVRTIFVGMSDSLGDRTRTLSELADAHETPGGNNHHVRTRWFDASNADAFARRLDEIYERLTTP